MQCLFEGGYSFASHFVECGVNSSKYSNCNFSAHLCIGVLVSLLCKPGHVVDNGGCIGGSPQLNIGECQSVSIQHSLDAWNERVVQLVTSLCNATENCSLHTKGSIIMLEYACTCDKGFLQKHSHCTCNNTVYCTHTQAHTHAHTYSITPQHTLQNVIFVYTWHINASLT